MHYVAWRQEDELYVVPSTCIFYIFPVNTTSFPAICDRRSPYGCTLIKPNVVGDDRSYYLKFEKKQEGEERASPSRYRHTEKARLVQYVCPSVWFLGGFLFCGSCL